MTEKNNMPDEIYLQGYITSTHLNHGDIVGNIFKENAMIEDYDGNMQEPTRYIRADKAQHQPIAGGEQALMDSLENAKSLCEEIVAAYPRVDINHVDFRVQVTKWAQDLLDDDFKELNVPQPETNKTAVFTQSGNNLPQPEAAKVALDADNQAELTLAISCLGGLSLRANLYANHSECKEDVLKFNKADADIIRKVIDRAQPPAVAGGDYPKWFNKQTAWEAHNGIMPSEPQPEAAKVALDDNEYHRLCAQCWSALGITEYTGKHIVEHIRDLIKQNETHKKAYWDLLESWSDLRIKYGVAQEQLNALQTPASDERGKALDWSGLDNILRGMRARNEEGGMHLTNWIADNKPLTQQSTAAKQDPDAVELYHEVMALRQTLNNLIPETEKAREQNAQLIKALKEWTSPFDWYAPSELEQAVLMRDLERKTLERYNRHKEIIARAEQKGGE